MKLCTKKNMVDKIISGLDHRTVVHLQKHHLTYSERNYYIILFFCSLRDFSHYCIVPALFLKFASDDFDVVIYLFVHIFIFRAASDFPSGARLCL